MADDFAGPKRRGMLEFFGMETGEKAREVSLWALPYLLVLVAALAGLSYLVQRLFPLPVWIHVLAIVLAVVYFFLFMARVRQAGDDARLAGEKERESSDT